MRVLLDECVPKRLKSELVGHDARTVQEMGWAGKRNGELLAAAAAEFDAFLTVDRNLAFQQDLSGFDVAVIVLIAETNRFEELRALTPRLLAVIGSAKRRTITFVGR